MDISKFFLIISFIFVCNQAPTKGANVQLSYTNSWFGNSGPNKQSHIPINADYLFVHPDGTAFSICDWDEGGIFFV